MQTFRLLFFAVKVEHDNMKTVNCENFSGGRAWRDSMCPWSLASLNLVSTQTFDPEYWSTSALTRTVSLDIGLQFIGNCTSKTVPQVFYSWLCTECHFLKFLVKQKKRNACTTQYMSSFCSDELDKRDSFAFSKFYSKTSVRPCVWMCVCVSFAVIQCTM